MCFVQHGDSIQGLAEKYNVSAQQILWANQLEANQDVYAGQVLYIPVKTIRYSGNSIFIGGASLNKQVVRWLH
ncbi:LysM peptidoglycan-binding domain-containing protein [Bacillus sp. N9]